MKYQVDRERLERSIDWMKSVAQTFYRGGRDEGPTPSVAIFFELEDSWGTEVVLFPEFGRKRFEDLRTLGMLQAAAGREVVAVALMTEVWLAEIPTEDVDLPNLPMPSEHPDRVEALMVAAMSRDDYSVVYTYPILRDANGRGTLREPRKMEGIREDSILSEFWTGYSNARFARDVATVLDPPYPKG